MSMLASRRTSAAQPATADLAHHQAARARRYDRAPSGEAYAYRGYTIAPMAETPVDASRSSSRTRWDVLETIQAAGAEPLVTVRKTCASKITAEGWVDAYGDPALTGSPAGFPADIR